MLERLPNASICHADAADLPFSNSSIAGVFGADILEHVVDPIKVLSEVHRVLKRGGRLHMYIPCEGNPGTVYQRYGHYIKRHWGGHIQAFTTESVLHLLQQYGFSILNVRHSDYALVQHMDYFFYLCLSKSKHPELLWAGQSLRPGGGVSGRLLRSARRFFSALAWLESSIRHDNKNAMGLHVTALKN